MAITFEANYSKKLGLPGFSSHQYSVAFKTELTDINLGWDWHPTSLSITAEAQPLSLKAGAHKRGLAAYHIAHGSHSPRPPWAVPAAGNGDRNAAFTRPAHCW